MKKCLISFLYLAIVLTSSLQSFCRYGRANSPEYVSPLKNIGLKLYNGFKVSFKKDPVTPLTFLAFGYLYLFKKDYLFKEGESLTLEGKIFAFTIGSVWMGSVFKNAFLNDILKKNNIGVRVAQAVIDHPLLMIPAALVILPQFGPSSSVEVIDDFDDLRGLA